MPEPGSQLLKKQPKTIKTGRWQRVMDYDSKELFTITTDRYRIILTGGSAILMDKNSGEEQKRIKGYNYLYTGDVNPAETELFALENGKHFYIISLEDFTQKLRVTLPRTYESIDIYGEYSEDGALLYVPVYKYLNGEFYYWMCEYETESYSLVSMRPLVKEEIPHWP